MFKKLSLGILFILLLTSGCRGSSQIKDLYFESRESYNRGNYEEALIGLSLLLREDLPTQWAEEAEFLLGASYYNLKAFYLSGETFQAYIEHYPYSEKVSEAWDYLKRINEIITQEEYSRQEMKRELTRAIRAYQEAAQREPEDAQLHFELGNLYWEMGEYEKAVNEYKRTMELDSSFKNNSLIAERYIQFRKMGALSVPKKTVPLGKPIIEISRTHSYNLIDRFFVVTGKISNFGEKEANNLRVIVTLYDFYDRVLDTGYDYIGYLAPGETRAFSVKIPYFKKIQVNRFECKPLYN